MAQNQPAQIDEQALASADLFSDARIQLIRNQVGKQAPQDVFLAMIDFARRRNLDPLAKQVALIKFGNDWQMIVTIDGYRAIAEQSGTYAGMDAPIFTYVGDQQTPAGKRIPDSATVTVYKLVNGQRYGFAATVFWEEYSTGKNNWNTMPRTMLAKVAESHALRKAFPAVLSGTFTQEEMDQAIETTGRVVEASQRQPQSRTARPQTPRPQAARAQLHGGATDGKALHFQSKLQQLAGSIGWTADDFEALSDRDFGKSFTEATGDELEAIYGDLQQMFREDPPALEQLKRAIHADPNTGEVIDLPAESAVTT